MSNCEDAFIVSSAHSCFEDIKVLGKKTYYRAASKNNLVSKEEESAASIWSLIIIIIKVIFQAKVPNFSSLLLHM